MNPAHVIAWQGWSVAVPADWNPVRIDGDHAGGTLLLADLHGPRLGLHWQTPGRRTPIGDAVDRRLRDEVGRLAAAEAVAWDGPAFAEGLLYCDPSPPGRDVFVGLSPPSGRLLTAVFHASGRSDRLRTLLTATADTPADAATHWSVFDLSFVTPPGVRVRAERFHAGDLAVLLNGPGRRATVLRQVVPASLALARRPLDGWLRQLPFTTPKLYRDRGPPVAVSSDADGRTLDGRRLSLRRRRRLAWAWFVPPSQTVLAVHDAANDRLVVAQGGDADALAALVRSAVQ